jgi:hypothetical protein
MQLAQDGGNVGNEFDLRVLPDRRDIDGHRYFTNWQHSVDELGREGAMDEVLVERLTVGFPVDHIFISCHYVLPYSLSEGLALDSSPVSGCNGLALTV